MPTTNKPDSSPVILLGTATTLSLLADQLRLLPDAPPAAAYLNVEDGEATLGRLAKLRAESGASVAFLSLPNSMRPQLAALQRNVRDAGLDARVIPPLNELLEGIVPATVAKKDRDIDVADLIGRTPYGIDRRAVAGVLEGSRVLITGAGGSIGSEIARITATFHPSELLLMERSENALFEIDRQIARKFPDVKRRALLHDIADADATMRHVLELKPDVVFHAAAHKHVPLMEDHPSHALTNNLFGTKSVADAALACGSRRFVLISSDKAVNPTSVMGATKRLAEMYTQGLHRQARAVRADRATGFSMVRFGNVLGSACSVLPIWSNQIAEGGPITVTDPRMTRYFMTIHEAAMLVIQSAAIPAGDDAAVFVLDMGEPVKILDLAMRFVRAQGFAPVVSGTAFSADGDLPRMEIALTGKRPGEKLHEELCYAAEQLRPTTFPGIHAWAGEMPAEFNLPAMVAELGAARQMTDKQSVVRAIRKHVPEMRPEQTIEAKSVQVGLAA
ncbi:MAG: polysaccharide biosynthesis protein [Phycisphaerales bacterium]|nr:polysaccharide biosynthesis protein [Planctomycetota bacterium]